MEFATILLIAVLAYAAIGIAFAIAFVTVGVSRVDRASIGAPFTFRVLILPGCAALWPYLALRWRRAAATQRGEGRP